MIRMKAPEGHSSLAIGQSQYKVVNGVVEVAPGHVRHAHALGYLLNSSDNNHAQTKLDLDGAIAKASAAPELRVLMQAPEGVSCIVIDGEQLNIREDQDRVVSVPVSMVAHLKRQGFTDYDEPADALDTMTVAELGALLKEQGVDVPKRANRAELVRLAKEARAAASQAGAGSTSALKAAVGMAKDRGVEGMQLPQTEGAEG